MFNFPTNKVFTKFMPSDKERFKKEKETRKISQGMTCSRETPFKRSI